MTNTSKNQLFILAIPFLAILMLCLLAAALGVSHANAARLEAENAALRAATETLFVEAEIAHTNRRLPRAVVRRIVAAGFACSAEHGIDPFLLFAAMQQESHFNPQAVGAAGERGLMQILRTTAGDLGLQWERAFDVQANTCAGAAYLASHVRARGIENGLRRYNGGGDPHYDSRVLARYAALTNREPR